MVQRILRTLSGRIRGLHQAAYLLAGFTLAAQVLAIVRDRIFAHAFGAGTTLDIYYAAFKIPDLVFALVASLVSAYVLIPRITSLDAVSSKKLLSHSASFLLISGGLLSIVAWILMPTLLFTLFPSFAHLAEADAFIALSRLLLLQPLLLGLSGIITSVTQVHRRFMLFALSPILYNVGIIVGVLFLYPTMGLSGIGLGVILGAFLHVAVHIPFVHSKGLLPVLTIPSPNIVWSIIKDSVPRSLALSLGAITTLLLTSIAGRVGDGSVSVFTLAGNIEAVPLALIGASYATAAFPVLSQEAGKGRSQEFHNTLSVAARHIIFWSTIATVFIIVFRAHIVRVLLGSGAFDWNATRLTAALLAVLVVGLVAQGFILLCSRAFYAAKRSWMPLVIQLFGLIASSGGALLALTVVASESTSLFFIENLLRVEGVSGTQVLLIAAGASAGQILMGLIALATLSQVAKGLAGPLTRPLFEALGASIVGGGAAYLSLTLMGNIAPLSTLSSVLAQTLVAGMVGLVVTAGVLYVLKNQELIELVASVKKLTASALPPSGTILNDRSSP
jgi:putative peptidoglycan lipid II flippase